HQHQQRQVKAFACCACPRSFARKHDLQRHIRVHTGAKPYSCLNCTKAFARTDALKRH
ncbi:C2H2-type zinc finger transcription factor, partial [Mucor lusitanicus CBS 277.49]